ncbi:hypothetical protein ERC79_15455 [Rhodococcus sp. ABRD24]|uniref:hypothetical protein n=1 Tax=Rhodococcus sp. ABRD24 TaxID=2507582 RepID=UPI001039CBE0|nr:hypothetical protein [Rhodococcus sp. ABRD24]QBJ97185.1 hypothetical protein ERC79_15455 [Rhodococcus sp. ABRD24]
MSKINRKLPIALCAVAASAGIALGVTPAASATVGSTYTAFSISCVGTAMGLSQSQAQSYGATVDHQVSGSNQSFAISFDSQTVPSTALGYKVSGLSNTKIRVQIDGSTYVSHSLSGGSGYSGTATATKTTSTPTGSAIIEIAIPNIPAGVTVTLPTLTVVQGSTVAPKFSTGNGGNGIAATQNEGKYGYGAGNFFTFDSIVTVPLIGTVTAPTTCLPTNVQFPSVGAFPILNAGAGVLHS